MTFLLAFIAYLLGSIPFGYLIVKLKEGQDVRSSGSGNIGATNVLRTAGRGSAVLTLLLDASQRLPGRVACRLEQPRLAADCCTGGHRCRFGTPLSRLPKFKGGKGVSTVLGVFLYASPIPILIAAGSFVCVVVVFRYVSLGSLVAAVVFPAAYLLSPTRGPCRGGCSSQSWFARGLSL